VHIIVGFGGMAKADVSKEMWGFMLLCFHEENEKAQGKTRRRRVSFGMLRDLTKIGHA